MTKRLPPELKKHRRSIQKACVFCHEKHIQCDDSRPCKNCTKRNIAHACRDNIRKKRKLRAHLGEHEDASKSPSTDLEVYASTGASLVDTGMPVLAKQSAGETEVSTQETTFSPDADFDSMWANDEYMKLKDFVTTSNCYFPTDDSKPRLAGIDDALLNDPEFPPDLHQDADLDQDHTGPNNSNSNSDSDRNASVPSTDSVFSKNFISLDMLSDGSLNDFSPLEEKEAFGEDRFDTLCEPPTHLGGDADASVTTQSTNVNPLEFRKGFPSVKDLYLKQEFVKPHNYQQAYLQLKNMLQDKFSIETDQRLLPGLIKSILENYAPRFTALTSNMVPEDLVLQEILLQRLLFEKEDAARLVNCTPMAVWRRTGELCFASSEFLSLTGFSKEEVFATNRFIFEFWDNQSILDYFDQFEKVLAFGDSNPSSSSSPEDALHKANFGRVSLILRNNVTLDCASCWTVVRDNFNIPLLIMGQFLPIFSKK